MNLSKLKQYLLTPTCLRCGSLFCDDSLFCESCFQIEIASRIHSDSPSHIVNFKHHYLIAWNKNESDVISQLIYRLKSDNSCLAWSFYAYLFYRILKEKIDFKNYQALIPIPGSKKNSVHAKIFAQEFSKLSGLPTLDILTKKADLSEQKVLSAAQRKAAAGIVLKTPMVEHFTKYIFVDDVLTTGQSFFQSNKAVNGQNENIIITLFYRPRL